jgi:hypothetical protein
MSLSGKGRRNKGLVGEREVAHAFAAAGFPVKNLDGGGDQLVVLATKPLHLEVKRQETIAMGKWTRQAEAEAPAGYLPVVVYRRSHEPWRVSLLLDDFLGLL